MKILQSQFWKFERNLKILSLLNSNIREFEYVNKLHSVLLLLFFFVFNLAKKKLFVKNLCFFPSFSYSSHYSINGLKFNEYSNSNKFPTI